MNLVFSKEINNPKQYNINQLVDHHYVANKIVENTDQSIICDIDKTYLETNYDSFFDLAKIPFEEAEDKITVPGAKETLYAARWGHANHPEATFDLNIKPRPLHFVSSSPPQLRGVIHRKFILDGLDWTSDTFKNQIYNLRKGRFSLLRHQVAFKSKAILDIIVKNKAKEYFMIGDSGESDAYVYMGIKLLLDGKLSTLGYKKYLEYSGVEDNVSTFISKILENKTINSKVKGIFIRDIDNHKLERDHVLTGPIFVFSNYLELVIMFMNIGLIQCSSLWQQIRIFHNQEQMSIYAIYEILKNFLVQKRTIQMLLIDEIKSVLGRLSRLIVNDNVCLQDTVCLPNAVFYDSLDEEFALFLANSWSKKIFSKS